MKVAYWLVVVSKVVVPASATPSHASAKPPSTVVKSTEIANSNTSTHSPSSAALLGHPPRVVDPFAVKPAHAGPSVEDRYIEVRFAALRPLEGARPAALDRRQRVRPRKPEREISSSSSARS